MRDPEIVAAGYLLLRPKPRPSYTDPSLLPDEILSASECVCPQFPDTSTLAWVKTSKDDRDEALDEIGLATSRRSEAESWATDHFGRDFGWPSVFFSADGALAARARFFGEESTLKVVGLGLPSRWRDEFVADASPPPARTGFAPHGESGYLQCIRRQQMLSPGGRILGFELLNVEFGQVAHSWLCNGLENHCAKVLGVRPAANGLIENAESAERCRNEVARDEVGAEPGLWLPWLLVEYT